MNKLLIKRVASSAAFFILAAVLLALFRLSIVDDSASYIRLQMHELYEGTEKLDIVILGTSLAQEFITEDIDEELGTVSFNLGTDSQMPIGGYYLLMEALKYREIDQVVYHISYADFSDRTAQRPLNYMGNLRILSAMKPGVTRARMAGDALGNPVYIDTLALYQRNKESYNLETAVRNIQLKLTNKKYREYSPDFINESDNYTYRHHGNGNRTIRQENPQQYFSINDRVFEESSVQFEYLQKIIELCREKDIELIFVSAPFHKSRVVNPAARYPAAYEVLRNISDQYGIPFWDFNLKKEEILEFGDEDYYDSAHLYHNSAAELTQLFLNVYEDYKNGIDVEEKYFYASVNEFYKQACRDVYTIGLTAKAEEDRIVCQAQAIKLEDTEALYKFKLFSNGELIEETSYIDEPTYYFELGDLSGYSVECSVIAPKAGSGREISHSVPVIY